MTLQLRFDVIMTLLLRHVPVAEGESDDGKGGGVSG